MDRIKDSVGGDQDDDDDGVDKNSLKFCKSC